MSPIAATSRGLRGVLFVCLVCLSLSTQSAGDPHVLVTASRITESLSDSLWSSTVLTRADIEARQAVSMEELLSGLAGFGFDNSGGLGKATSAFLRGAESDHTLLLIDGMRVGSATLGIPPFELIPVEQIERIEVVRGPRSTLYGSDAVGGVIQIFTRNRLRSGLQFDGMMYGGSHDTRRVSGSLRGGGERAWFNFGAETLDTDGFNACSPLSLALGGGCFANEPDKDGFRNRSASLALGMQLGRHLTAELRSLATDGHTEFDGSFTNRADIAERVASLHLTAALGAQWQARALFGWNEDVQDNFHEDVARGYYKTRRNSASLQLDGTLASKLRAIAGFDYLDDRVDSTTVFVRSSRSTVGAFTELRSDFGAWSALAGARFEDNEQFGGQATGNLGLAHRFAAGPRFTATWGTAFRAPTFNELYYPGFGNPQLAPEKSRAAELGLDGSLGAVRWSLHAYQTDFDDLIAFDAATFSPRNIARARVRGAELQGEWRHEVWKIAGQVTRLDPRDRSPGAGETVLPRRSRLSGALELWRQGPAASIGALGRCEGRRFDDLANTRPLGGYCTLDLVGDWTVGRSWRLQSRISNLFDRGYSTAAFFNQDGRHYSVTLRYQPAGDQP